MASAAEIALCALIPLLCIAVVVIWICYCYNRQTLCFQRDEDRTLLYKDSWSQNSNGSCNSPRSLQTSSERDIRKATASVGGARGKLQGESTYIAYTVCNPSFSETAPVGQAVPAQPTLRQTHAFNNYYAADLASGSLINLGVEVPLEYGNPTPISSRSASSLGIQQLVAIPEAIDVPASAFQRHSSVPVVEQDGYLGGAASSAATPPPISVGHSIPTTPNLLQVESTFSYNGSQRDYSSPSVSRRHSSELGSPDNPMPPGWQRGRRRSSMQMPIDHRLIDPRLYESQRTASFDADSVDGDADDKSMLHLTLEFNPVVEELHVKLIQATNLEKRVFSGTSDPYCTATLLPDCIKRQSKVHHKTQNPEFEEKFTFPVLSEDLQDKTIRVKVYDFDQFSRDECTGIMELQLKEIDFEMTPCIDMWRSIRKVGVSDETSKDNKQYGDLMLSLAYLPSAEKLTVTIQKARNLVLPDAKIPDACVKVSLVRGGERVKKKRTSTIGASQHPVFNEALTFNLTHDDARAKDVTVVCHVVHEQNKLAGHQNVELGDVTLGIASSGGEERQHWAEMLSQRVNTPVARWHSLRPSPAVASSAAPAADQLASSEANS